MKDVMSALSTWQPGSSVDRARPDSILSLFDMLNAIIGPKWQDSLAGVPVAAARDEWAKGLAGFRGREIKRGLEACRGRSFAPNLGEFARLCRPCLDSDAAWVEAELCMRQRAAGSVGDWTHPAVFRAATQMSMEIAQGDTSNWSRRRWAALLKRELAAGWGEDVPPPALRIAATPAKTRPPTAAERAAWARLFSRDRDATNGSNEVLA